MSWATRKLRACAGIALFILGEFLCQIGELLEQFADWIVPDDYHGDSE